jgi:hypothetical protein
MGAVKSTARREHADLVELIDSFTCTDKKLASELHRAGRKFVQFP